MTSPPGRSEPHGRANGTTGSALRRRNRSARAHPASDAHYRCHDHRIGQWSRSRSAGLRATGRMKAGSKGWRARRSHLPRCSLRRKFRPTCSSCGCASVRLVHTARRQRVITGADVAVARSGTSAESARRWNTRTTRPPGDAAGRIRPSARGNNKRMPAILQHQDGPLRGEPDAAVFAKN